MILKRVILSIVGATVCLMMYLNPLILQFQVLNYIPYIIFHCVINRLAQECNKAQFDFSKAFDLKYAILYGITLHLLIFKSPSIFTNLKFLSFNLVYILFLPIFSIYHRVLSMLLSMKYYRVF